MTSATEEMRDDAGVPEVEDHKRKLEHQVEQSRESIAHTVADIKDAVADEYQSIKQGMPLIAERSVMMNCLPISLRLESGLLANFRNEV